jgi:hypothetical protein
MQGMGRVMTGVTPVSPGLFEQGAPTAFACAAWRILIYSPLVPFPVATTLKELVPAPQPDLFCTVLGAEVADALDCTINVCKEESTHLLRLTYLLACSWIKRILSDCVIDILILPRGTEKKRGCGKIDSPPAPKD